MMYFPKCKGGLPHDYTTKQHKDGTVLDFSNVLYEICIECGDQRRWVKDRKTGAMRHTQDYWLYHIRDFAQSFGKTRPIYEMLYGDPRKRDLTKAGTNGNH